MDALFWPPSDLLSVARVIIQKHKSYYALTIMYTSTFICVIVLKLMAASPNMTQLVKNLPATWETWVWSLGWEDPPEKETATHSSILAWRMDCLVHGVTKSRTGLSDLHFHFPPIDSKVYLGRKHFSFFWPWILYLMVSSPLTHQAWSWFQASVSTIPSAWKATFFPTVLECPSLISCKILLKCPSSKSPSWPSCLK